MSDRSPKTPPKDRLPKPVDHKVRRHDPTIDAGRWAKTRHEDRRMWRIVAELGDDRLTVPNLQAGLLLIREAQTVDLRRNPLWCDNHESDKGCDCDTRVAIVAAHDGTGEAAITPDKARSDEKAISAALDRGDVGAVVRIVATYEQRSATTLEMRRVELENDPGCESCVRLERWEPPRGNPTDVKGNLPKRMDLCSWCYRWVLDTGRIPTSKELEEHHRGKHVFRPEHPKQTKVSR